MKLFEEKSKVFLALDIGTEAIKVLVFQKTKKIEILGSSLAYFDEFSASDTRALAKGEDERSSSTTRIFEKTILKKTVSQVLKEVKEESGNGSEGVFLSLPANILRAKVIFHSLKRKDLTKNISKKEEEEIHQQILIKAQKEISQKTFQKYGILPNDLQLVSSKILEIKIDGYEVPGLLDYKGENLDLRILITFLPKYYFNDFKELINYLGSRVLTKGGEERLLSSTSQVIGSQEGKENSSFSTIITKKYRKFLKVLRVPHEARNLIAVFEKPNAIFLDIGGKISQIFLINNGKLEIVDSFDVGAAVFTQAISSNLGLSEQSARILKERYSKGELSEEVRKRIKEILWQACQTWFNALKNKLKEGKDGGLLPPSIYIFGGGSLLPEIGKILNEGDWENLSFISEPEVKFIYPKDFKYIEDKTKKLNSPQDIPLLLISYASHIGEGSGPSSARKGERVTW